MAKKCSCKCKQERHDDKNNGAAGFDVSANERNQQCIEADSRISCDGDPFKKSMTTTRAPYPIDWSGQ